MRIHAPSVMAFEGVPANEGLHSGLRASGNTGSDNGQARRMDGLRVGFSLKRTPQVEKGDD